jgi:energy-coupling factor transporter ATP-binding protein EcfA2
MAMRLIPATPPQVDELGLPSSVVNLANLSSGLVLFCGQTGSGKTTSMAALIDRINQSRACHILTIEDPVEYLHPNRRAIVHQREVGSDTAGFAVGLRSALRQDPDVLLVGELRDLETMATALAAAETGHLVLATVHSSSAASAVTRIVSSFPTGEQDQIRQPPGADGCSPPRSSPSTPLPVTSFATTASTNYQVYSTHQAPSTACVRSTAPWPDSSPPVVSHQRSPNHTSVTHRSISSFSVSAPSTTLRYSTRYSTFQLSERNTDARSHLRASSP